MNNALLIYSKEVRNRIHINQLVQLSLPQLHCPRTSLSLSEGSEEPSVPKRYREKKKKNKQTTFLKIFLFTFLAPPPSIHHKYKDMKAHRHLLQKVSPAQKKKTFYSPYINIAAQMSLSHWRETFPSLNMPLQSSELRTITPGRRRAECRATPSQAQADAGHLGNGTIAPRHAASAVAHESERVIAVELSTLNFLASRSDTFTCRLCRRKRRALR